MREEKEPDNLVSLAVLNNIMSLAEAEAKSPTDYWYKARRGVARYLVGRGKISDGEFYTVMFMVSQLWAADRVTVKI